MKDTAQDNMGTNDDATPSAAEDMLADLGVSGAESDQLRALLGEVAALAYELPDPSDDVRGLLSGAIALRPRRRTLVAAAAVGALALGGVSAAAAANRLPEPVQEVVADATGGVVPHPVKPTNPPYDAPGHVINKPKATKAPKPHETKTPKPLNTAAPGQLQKLTKPDPAAPGPAHPADPGSHGRVHNETKVNGADKPKTEPTDKVDGDTDDAERRQGKSD